jgi:hypothetical protein
VGRRLPDYRRCRLPLPEQNAGPILALNIFYMVGRLLHSVHPPDYARSDAEQGTMASYSRVLSISRHDATFYPLRPLVLAPPLCGFQITVVDSTIEYCFPWSGSNRDSLLESNSFHGLGDGRENPAMRISSSTRTFRRGVRFGAQLLPIVE